MKKGFKLTVDKRMLKRVLNDRVGNITKFIVDEYAEIRTKEIKKNLKKSKDTGKLQKSFKFKSKKKKAIIFSKSSYADIQNYGGKIKLTKKMRGKMWALYYETNDDMYKAIALTKKNHVTLKPKRFLNVNKKVIARKLNKRLNKFIRKQNKR